MYGEFDTCPRGEILMVILVTPFDRMILGNKTTAVDH